MTEMRNAKCRMQNAKCKTQNGCNQRGGIRRLVLMTIAASTRVSSSPSSRSACRSSTLPSRRARQMRIQYTASRASLRATCTYRRNSRLEEAAFASSRLAPTDVPARTSWSTRHLVPCADVMLKAALAARQPNSNERSRMSCERSLAMHSKVQIPNQLETTMRSTTHESFGRFGRRFCPLSRVRCSQFLHSAFCILHSAFCILHLP
jgi:hypothetical protein